MRIAALVVGVLILLSLLWIGSEQHLQSCVTEQTAKTQAVKLRVERGDDPDNPLIDEKAVRLEGSLAPGADAEGAIDDCSRWPF